MSLVRCDKTQAWGALTAHFDSKGKQFDLRTAFGADAARFDHFALQAPGVFADLSKNRWDASTRALLTGLAAECGLEARRDAMFAGEPINLTEGRAVLHTALRAPAGAKSLGVVTDAAIADVHSVLEPLLAYAERVRAQAGTQFTDVLNIGIGGSDLGPQMAVIALEEFRHPKLRFHFVSNVDGHDIAPVLARLDPKTTLVIVASKTFTTQETLANANVAREWFTANGGTDVATHFVGVTTNIEAAAKFGITTTFGFWDWVGGRYSLWSAIGLSLAIAIGADGFKEFLAGAHAMDEHFRTTPLARNLPVQLALIDVWYRNFHGFTSRSVAPYHQGTEAPAGLPAAARDGIQRQARRRRRPRRAVRDEPGRLGRARHQRPARVLPDAAPGHRRRAGGIHRRQDARRGSRRALCRPAHQAARQLPRAVAGADAGQGAGRGGTRIAADGLAHDRARGDRRASRLPRQSPEHDAGAGRADAAHAGRADRAVRAPRVLQRCAVGHQQLRPVGRRARQGLVQRLASALRHGRDGRPRRLDRRPPHAAVVPIAK